MNEHLAEISQHLLPHAIAVLCLDGSGWHSSPPVELPDKIVLLPLPAYAPELNPMENVGERRTSTQTSSANRPPVDDFHHRCCNQQVWEVYETILDACV